MMRYGESYEESITRPYMDFVNQYTHTPTHCGWVYVCVEKSHNFYTCTLTHTHTCMSVTWLWGFSSVANWALYIAQSAPSSATPSLNFEYVCDKMIIIVAYHVVYHVVPHSTMYYSTYSTIIILMYGNTYHIAKVCSNMHYTTLILKIIIVLHGMLVF